MKTVGYRLIDEDGFVKKINRMSQVDWSTIVKENTAEIYNRSRTMTPVSTEKTNPGKRHGQLRQRVSTVYQQAGKSVVSGVFGYKVSYAPHVEFGHRVVVHGKQVGYVPGQYYLRRNVDTQRPIFNRQVKEALEK